MKNSLALRSLCLVLVVSFLPRVVARVEDWPRWRGAAGDGHAPAGAWKPEALPAEPKVAWRVALGDGHGSPVVADGRVFILDKVEADETLRVFEEGTGRELWRRRIYPGNDDNQGKGPRGTPLVEGDRVYVQTMRGEFQCLRVTDGERRWRKNFTDDFGAIFIGEKPNPKAIGATRHGNNGAPIIDGEHIIVQAGGVEGAGVVCLNKLTGEVIWKSQNDQAGYAGAIFATLAGRRQVVAFTAIGVIGLDPRDGRLLWRFPITTTWARHATTPTVVGDIVTVSSHEHGMFGLRIEREGDGFKATQAWLTKEAAINFASPVAVDGFLYGVGPTKTFICVEAATGRVAWSQAGYFTGNAGQSHAGMVALGDRILALTDRGELVLLAAEPAAFRELGAGVAGGVGRVQVCGQTWCSPAYANGRMYLRDKKELIALSLR